MAANREAELAKLSAEELVQHLRFSCPCLEAEYDAAARVLAERERRAAETEKRLQVALSQVAALRRNLGGNREEKFLAEADSNLRAGLVEIDKLTKSFATDAPICAEQLAVAGTSAGAHLELALLRVGALREMHGADPSFKPPQQDVAVEVEEVTLNMGTAMEMEMHVSAPSVEPPQLDVAEAEESNMGTAIEMEMHGVVVPPIEALPPQDVAETEETAVAYMETAMDISAPDRDPAAPVLDLPLQEVVGEGQEGNAPPHNVVDADAEETAHTAVDIADAAEASSLAQVLLQLKEDQVPRRHGMDIDIIDLVDTGSDEDVEEYTVAPPRKRQQPSRVAKNKGTNRRGRPRKVQSQNKPSSPAAENNFRCWLYTRVPSSSPPASGAGSTAASPVTLSVPVSPPSIVEGPPLFLEHCTRERPWTRRSLFTEWLMSNGDQNGGVSENGQDSFVPLGVQPPSSPLAASTITEEVSPGVSSSKSTSVSVVHSTQVRRGLFPPTLTMRWRSHESMIDTFKGNLELCMHAVCALYRNKKLIVESSEGGQISSSFSTPLNTSQAYRATELAEFLSSGDPKGLVRKTKQDLVNKDATAPNFLEEVAILCSKQLFDIYKKKEDLFFC